MGIFKLNGIDYMGGGGGGNANEQTLTWAEYCALTEEEKSNGTTYYITDINGEGKDGFQPVIYSTEEREIGVWTDGKPLYQTTIHTGALTKDGNWHSIAHNIPNIDKIILCTGTVYAADNTAYPMPNYRPGLTQGICLDATTTNIEYIQNWLDSSPDSYVTLQYTKTTDQPGSGTWTPQGVPAAHYSTDEQVVGTWADGSTIYEKTITGTLGNGSQKTIDLSSEINCNLVIDIKGWIMSTDSSNSYQIWMHDTYVRYLLRGNNNLIIDKNGADNYGFDNPYTLIIRYTKTA